MQRHTNSRILLVLVAVFTMQSDTFSAQSRGTNTQEMPCPGDTVDQLAPQMAKTSRAFVASLKTATEADDRTAVSVMIRYPLAVHIGKRTFRIHTPEEFLQNYDRILNRAVRHAISDPLSSKCLFFSPEGFMIGDGEVWFQISSTGVYKVIAVNLGAVSNPDVKIPTK